MPVADDLLPLSRLDGNRAQTSEILDAVGVSHVHTRYSDGSGTMREVIEIAQKQDLDFILFTDHDTLQPLFDGMEGRHDELLVLTGTELTTPSGHLLAFGVSKEIPGYQMTTQEIIDAVIEQGGICFIAHPFGRRPWTDWTVQGYNGIEIHNISHDTLRDRIMDMVFWTTTGPSVPFYHSILERPDVPLGHWDQLLRTRKQKTVGIGGADAHEYRALGFKYAPYEIMLRYIRNHVLIPEGELNKENLLKALAAGHLYVSIELTASAHGFHFAAYRSRERLAIQGDTLTLRDKLNFEVNTPSPGHIFLYHDGKIIADNFGTQLQFKVKEPGVYRVEVSRHDRPWIYSNPITVNAP